MYWRRWKSCNLCFFSSCASYFMHHVQCSYRIDEKMGKKWKCFENTIETNHGFWGECFFGLPSDNGCVFCLESQTIIIEKWFWFGKSPPVYKFILIIYSCDRKCRILREIISRLYVYWHDGSTFPVKFLTFTYNSNHMIDIFKIEDKSSYFFLHMRTWIQFAAFDIAVRQAMFENGCAWYHNRIKHWKCQYNWIKWLECEPCLIDLNIWAHKCFT